MSLGYGVVLGGGAVLGVSLGGMWPLVLLSLGGVCNSPYALQKQKSTHPTGMLSCSQICDHAIESVTTRLYSNNLPILNQKTHLIQLFR